jgi:hypothetical protein
MSRIFYITKAIVITWVLLDPVSAWASRGFIYDARGSVSVAQAPSGSEEINPRYAIISDAVTPGMMVLTGSNSYAVLKFDDGQIVSMQANSTLLVRDYIYFPLKVKRSNIDFSLMKGGMRFITGQIGTLNPAAFKLSTPNGTIRVRGTDFFAVMTNDGLYTKVLSGSINLTNAAGVSDLTAGNTALTALSTSLPVAITAADVSAATFSKLAAIPVPKVQVAVAEPVPAVPEPSPAIEAATATATATAQEPVSATAGEPAPADALLISTAGGEAAGGAPAAPATAAAAKKGISGTMIAIGLGVAAVVAALASSSSTTTATHH